MAVCMTMVSRLIAWLIRGACAWITVATVAVAQSPPTVPVAEVVPELFYLQDDAGRLVPVPGFRYRDFIDLMRLRDGLPGQPEPPAAVLESVVATVTLEEPISGGTSVARTSPAELRLSVRQVKPGWVSVPVDLQGFLIGGPPVHEGPGKMFFAAARNAESSEARLWFHATPEQEVRHTVVISGGVPVESSASSDTVVLMVPPATASRVEIRSPRDAPSVAVRPASLPPVVAPAAEGETGTVVSVVGAAGRVEVRVSDGQANDPNVIAVPDVMVESVVRVDGKTAMTEATLRVANLPADVSSLRIALPDRTMLRRVLEPAVLVQRAGTLESAEIIVRVDRNLDGLAVVGLECERAIDASGRSVFNPLGFTVSGIPDWRQRGRVSVIVEGDWQVEWDDAGANRRIDPPPAARRPGLVAAFAYDSQPAALPVRVRPRGSRVVVEPEYRYGVSATRLTLDARLRVSVRGAAVSRLLIGLEEWEVEDVGPIGLIDATAVTTEGKRLVIPFQQGLTGDSVIDLRCSRPVDRSDETVSWSFPVPEANLVGPATVFITSEADVELVPETGAIRGLVRQVAPAPLRADGDRLALAYRLDGTDGVFQAQRRFLERRVDASTRTQVDIDRDLVRVTETIRLAVAHVPMEFIELLMPLSVARGDTLEMRQGGQRLNPLFEEQWSGRDGPRDAVERPTSGAVEGARRLSPGEDSDEPGKPDDPDGRVRVRAMLPVPLLGTGEVIVTYELPTPEVPPETTVAEDLPLVAPLEAKVVRQTLQVNTIDSLSVDLRGEEWKRDAAAPVGGMTRSWVTARFQGVAPLALAARRGDMSGETIVEASWLQTRMLADRREDTFAYAISSTADRLTLTLPESLFPADAEGPSSVEVWFDGRRVEDAIRADGSLEVLLQPGGDRSRALLEIRVGRPWTAVGMMGLAGLYRIDLVAPVFAEGVQQRRFYWEVHLPADQHAVFGPREWTTQHQWVWGAMGMERRSLVRRDALAVWVRANAGQGREIGQDVVDTGLGSRRGLYSGVGPPGIGKLWIAATWLLVLLVSGPVLTFGLVLAYVPAARSVGPVIGLAALLTLLVAIWPGIAPLLLQAALPGVCLALVAAVMRGLIRPPSSSARQQLPTGSSRVQSPISPSILVSASALHRAEGTTTSGRSAS